LAGASALEENTPFAQAAGTTDLDRVFPMLPKPANLMLAIVLSATACIAVSAAEREERAQSHQSVTCVKIPIRTI
jgi:hypothetical protein